MSYTSLHIFLYIFLFIFALLIGSFLNVCIYRIPLKRTVVKGRSYCTSCGKLIPWYCNIPLFSYIFLGGRCLYCKDKISIIYPIIELSNAFLWVFVFLAFGFTWLSLVISFMLSAILVMAAIKYQNH